MMTMYKAARFLDWANKNYGNSCKVSFYRDNKEDSAIIETEKIVDVVGINAVLGEK